MRRLIGGLVVLIACVIAIGFYMNWFTLSRPNRGGDDNKINVELTVDTDKVKADAAEAKDKAMELSRKD